MITIKTKDLAQQEYAHDGYDIAEYDEIELGFNDKQIEAILNAEQVCIKNDFSHISLHDEPTLDLISEGVMVEDTERGDHFERAFATGEIRVNRHGWLTCIWFTKDQGLESCIDICLDQISPKKDSNVLVPVVREHCEECGGQELLHDTSHKWDVEQQKYIHEAIHDQVICNDCGAENPKIVKVTTMQHKLTN